MVCVIEKFFLLSRGAVLWLALLAPAAVMASPAVAVSHPWIRFVPGESPMAGYFELLNQGDEPLVLTGASSQDFGGVMIHQSAIEHGQASMHHVDGGLSVPAHGSLRFAPGGYHLMLMGRQRALKAGDKVTLHLEFRHHPPVDATFPIKPVWYQEEKSE